MKKLYLLATLACFSFLSFGQPQEALNSVKVNPAIVVNENAQDRITKLEKEIQALKETNTVIQKELAEIKARLPIPKKGKKLVVSRTGSKQGVWVDQ